MKQIAIFASGKGTNTKNIIKHFKQSKEVHVRIILSNNTDAGVLYIAKDEQIESIVVNRKDFNDTEHIIALLKNRKIDLIVLAGFLVMIPPSLVNSFSIINIHPSLLPKYGGKGMYGSHVHEAVIQNNEKISGITIHRVNEQYDKGEILLQKEILLDKNETPESLQQKIHHLEHHFYPQIIESVLSLK
ncbi:phosphoribosylglycinamide formyltransferase [Halosquirtibacter laminarini]|uniref:Phosphoribosylglycinamide formyltransferase n=1 Tax=Halosquirtibacter laminarini TaxID=3374600 RepID=A0AC61NF65_9BACT|nr:phosphoribosylglycinamide formyltransferase [Prolixibacteraceae bacterium]